MRRLGLYRRHALQRSPRLRLSGSREKVASLWSRFPSASPLLFWRALAWRALAQTKIRRDPNMGTTGAHPAFEFGVGDYLEQGE